jgi:hypothetical protein
MKTSLSLDVTREQALARIEHEFSAAEAARKNGNDGMVRVCARRAAGVAITFWLEDNPRTGWGVDAMSQLRNLQTDPLMPDEVRAAAGRLTTKITGQFTSPFSQHPLADAQLIIDHLIT